MISISENTRLFTEERVSKYIKENCRLLYTIIAEVPDTKTREYSTIGIATKPDVAVEMCKKMMGNGIEVWVLKGDGGVESEKWDPDYFRDHFGDYIEVYYEKSSDNDDDDSDDSDDEDEHNDGYQDVSGITQTPRSMLNCALLEILQHQEILFRLIASVSFATGHPIDIESLLGGLQGQISKIVYALTFSRGGYEPKFKEGLGGTQVPYWTKRQIEAAKIDPEAENR